MLNYIFIFIVLVTIIKYIIFECIILVPKIIDQDRPVHLLLQRFNDSSTIFEIQ